MRFSVHVLGLELLTVDTGCDHSPPRPHVEASGGGEFAFGFGAHDDPEAVHVRREVRP